jgi:YidC/Oxa1 family membrane protein insertase
MRKNGVKVELFDNLKATFQKKSVKTATKNSTV